MEKDSRATTVADRYQILEPIGAGGMGVVVKAHDKVLDLVVAIKMIDSDQTGNAAARLQREATAAGKLSHRNIAKIFDFGQTPDGKPYMVMEMLEGKSLSDLIKEGRLISCLEAVPIFIQIAQGLAYAHENSIVHRDLKPSNIMLVDQPNGDRVAKILDFGIAKMMDENHSLTQKGALVGSPLYMSPEQAQGDEATRQSDIYSFGCLMFETLTGEPPFRGASAIETIYLHKNVAAPLLTDLISVQKLPRDIIDLVDECLRKIPANRPQNFSVIKERLSLTIDHIENRTLTREEKQRISNQHFRIRLYHFWKSKFGIICLSVILAGLLGLGLSIFHSEQKRIYESKTLSKAPADSIFGSSSYVNRKKIVKTNTQFFKSALRISDSPYGKGVMLRCDDSGSDEDMVEVKGRKIQVIHCNSRSYNGSGLAYVEKKYVTELSMHSSNFAQKNLHFIEEMPNLKSLCLGSEYLNDEGLKTIGKLHQLENLFLYSNNITDKGVAYLQTLSNLKTIDLGSNKITDNIVEPLAKLKSLTSIRVEDGLLSPNIGKKLANLENLKKISLVKIGGISEESIKALKSLQLTHLSLQDTLIDDSAFKGISQLKSLIELDLGNSRFSPASLKHLRKCPSLFCIDLNHNEHFSDELAKELAELKVSKLSMSYSNINDSQLSRLVKNRYLRDIQAEHCNLSGEAVKTFMDTFTRIWRFHCAVQFTPSY